MSDSKSTSSNLFEGACNRPDVIETQKINQTSATNSDALGLRGRRHREDPKKETPSKPIDNSKRPGPSTSPTSTPTARRPWEKPRGPDSSSGSRYFQEKRPESSPKPQIDTLELPKGPAALPKGPSGFQPGKRPGDQLPTGPRAKAAKLPPSYGDGRSYRPARDSVNFRDNKGPYRDNRAHDREGERNGDRPKDHHNDRRDNRDRRDERPRDTRMDKGPRGDRDRRPGVDRRDERPWDRDRRDRRPDHQVDRRAKRPWMSDNRPRISFVKAVRDTTVYERVVQVGEGTYGKVYKARNVITGSYVALKRLRMETEKEGFPITAIREMRLLQSLTHEHIVSLMEIMVENRHVYMVFEYADHDLTGLLANPEVKLSAANCKDIFRQLLLGIEYLHSRRVIHRDIKASNLLLDKNGILKVADFGLARKMKTVNSRDYTNRVITLWYRPPELLLGTTDYGREVDMWGIGCLLVELFTTQAVFQAQDELQQLHVIFEVMGTPTQEDWPTITDLPWYELVKPKKFFAPQFKQKYAEKLSPQCLDLAQKLLAYNPRRRLTARVALRHQYFKEDPAPERLSHELLGGEWHEFEAKKKRRKEREEKKQQEEMKKRLQEEEKNRELSTSVPASDTPETDEKMNDDDDSKNTNDDKPLIEASVPAEPAPEDPVSGETNPTDAPVSERETAESESPSVEKNEAKDVEMADVQEQGSKTEEETKAEEKVNEEPL